MPVPIKSWAKNNTKVIITLDVEQKKLITKIPRSKGLFLSAYLRLKTLEKATDKI